MPFSNPQWTFERIQFLSGVGLVSVLGGLLYRNEWSSIGGILRKSNQILRKKSRNEYTKMYRGQLTLFDQRAKDKIKMQVKDNIRML